MTKRVVVTGLGWVTPHGTDLQSAYARMVAGESGITTYSHTDLDAVVPAGQCSFSPDPWFTRLQLAGVDRVSQFALASSEMALEAAGYKAGEALPEDTGVFYGSGMGGATAQDDAYRSFTKTGRVHPLTVPATMVNAGAAHVAMRRKIHGPVLTYAVACSSSAAAISQAYKSIATGELELALAGGSEALLVPSAIRAWLALQTLAPVGNDAAAACRPFSKDRTGLVLGEGAAFLVLESEERARARGAIIYAELAGFGLSCDSTHLTKPDADGQIRALTSALKMAKLAPSDIGYCNAHGTATKIGDPVECEALNRLWGDAIGDLKVSSTKALHGHLLGGAGALEAAITIMALKTQQLPPNINVTEQDTDCQLPLVTHENNGASSPLSTPLEAALSNSFAFGGTNAVLLFKRAE